MKIEEVFCLLQSRVPKAAVKDYVNNPMQKRLVYTSFDGDYMNFLPDMLKFTYDSGYIPINPEAALGYYVSTNTHHGEKVPVMVDCIKTALLCDEMWIFTALNSHIPEGVLAEMMIWMGERRSSIKVVPFFDGYRLNSEVRGNTMQGMAYSLMNEKDIRAYVNERKKEQVAEIEEKLIKTRLDKALPGVYITANFYNYKHIDWTRAYCYKNAMCPVPPQNILPFHLYSEEKGEFSVRYLKDRLNLLDKCDQLLWFTNTKKIVQETMTLDFYSCAELYYWCSHRDQSRIQIIDWADAEVPKYCKPDKWALSRDERQEVSNDVANISE